jgi:hypothetical protein
MVSVSTWLRAWARCSQLSRARPAASAARYSRALSPESPGGAGGEGAEQELAVVAGDRGSGGGLAEGVRGQVG